jgi:antitoxin (DNA-binding transcriptional repressor) of toxin-antitoxin stability system
MQKIALKDAELRLAELIDEVASGEEIMITRDDGKVFKLVLVMPTKPYPKFGSAKGLVAMSDDFDEPLEDFKEYMS